MTRQKDAPAPLSGHTLGDVVGRTGSDDGLCGHVRVHMATVDSQWNNTPEVEPPPST